jgi:hypothetical protein
MQCFLFARGKTGRGMLLTTSSKVKNEWFCSSTSLFVFMAWTGSPLLLQYNKKMYLFKTVPSSSSTIHTLFFYRCVHNHCLLHNVIKTALIFSVFLFFPERYSNFVLQHVFKMSCFPTSYSKPLSLSFQECSQNCCLLQNLLQSTIVISIIY